MTIQELLSTVSDLGVLGMLIVALYGGSKQIWVWGWTYREKVASLSKEIEKVEKDRDEWKALALQGTSIAERGVTMAERTVKQP